ncbi:MAG: uncharacterized membrane protein YbhN (UPF0104 family) [Candidatus Binatia bacterium]|jgi:uncharacterized membrane protein YbhN (UPF0104 family)
MAVWLVARQVDPAELAGVLAATEPLFVALVLALYLVGQGMTAYRWYFIAHSVGFAHHLTEMTRYYFIGMFFNLFGPSTLGGDVVRGLYLGERDGRRLIALNTVLFDRLSGLAMLVAVAMLALAAFGRFDLPWSVVAITFAVGIGMAIGWFVIPPVVRRFLPPSSRIRVLIEKDLDSFWRDRGLLFRAAWVSAGFHVLQVLALIVLGAAVGMDVDWRYYFIFHPLVTILSALPISLAGLGIREMGYLWFLERQGVDHATAVAFGLGWFVVLTASSLFGGLVYWVSGSGLPPVRSKPDSTETGPS